MIHYVVHVPRPSGYSFFICDDPEDAAYYAGSSGRIYRRGTE